MTESNRNSLMQTGDAIRRSLTRNSHYSHTSTQSWVMSNQQNPPPPPPEGPEPLTSPVRASRPLPDPIQPSPAWTARPLPEPQLQAQHHPQLHSTNADPPDDDEEYTNIDPNFPGLQTGYLSEGMGRGRRVPIVESPTAVGVDVIPPREHAGFVGGFVNNLRRLPRVMLKYRSFGDKRKYIRKATYGSGATLTNATDMTTGNTLPLYASNPPTPVAGPSNTRYVEAIQMPVPHPAEPSSEPSSDILGPSLSQRRHPSFRVTPPSDEAPEQQPSIPLSIANDHEPVVPSVPPTAGSPRISNAVTIFNIPGHEEYPMEEPNLPLPDATANRSTFWDHEMGESVLQMMMVEGTRECTGNAYNGAKRVLLGSHLAGLACLHTKKQTPLLVDEFNLTNPPFSTPSSKKDKNHAHFRTLDFMHGSDCDCEYMSQALRLRDTEYALKARNNNGHVSARADAESIVTRRDAGSYHERFGLGARDLDNDTFKQLAARSLVRRKVPAVPDAQSPSMQDAATMTQDTGAGTSAVGPDKATMAAQTGDNTSAVTSAANGVTLPPQNDSVNPQSDSSGKQGGGGPHSGKKRHHHDGENHHDQPAEDGNQGPSKHKRHRGGRKHHNKHPDNGEHEDGHDTHKHKHHGPHGNHGPDGVNGGSGPHHKNHHHGQTPPPTQDNPGPASGASGSGGDPAGSPPVTTAGGVSGSGPSADAASGPPVTAAP
ncbi:hypothetical protein H0H93_003484 [Arthromyces matolae]|nr:hypothetical protein H0H93_003484 [Arthromyces matolae]